MVFPLIDDILDYSFFVTLTARECPIFLTPSAELREIDLLLGPLAAPLLNVAHKVAKWHCRRQLNEHVDMVARAVDAIEFTASAFDNRPDVTVKMLTGLVGNGYLAAIGVDDNIELTALMIT